MAGCVVFEKEGLPILGPRVAVSLYFCAVLMVVRVMMFKNEINP
jgi:hypothetical protein